MYKYFIIVDNKISSWESKGLSNEKISFFPRLINNQPPSLAYDNASMKLTFNGEFLKHDKVTYNHGPIVNIYIVYKSTPFTTSTKSAALEICLSGAANLTKNDYISKYKYSGYSIGFDSKGTFSHPSGRFGEKGIILGVDMSSSVDANNKTRNILVFSKDFIQ